MAMVKRLHLQGVRSFSPQDNKGQVIEFGSPLTLILGVNGSGKTTIIEALKFALTSQFPPNSAKGASFVNDPKLTGAGKALAKIELHLVDAQGNKYVTSRKLQTTVKNKQGDLSMAQLEGTIRCRTVKGESKEISNKFADIKFEMSRLMGVSEAILSHVIFCHQEESCWPLDEGKKVKTTFDAIFNTIAYKKCFDRLHAVDKELTTKIQVEKEGLRFVIENRQKAREKALELDEKKIELQQKSDSITGLSQGIKEMEVKLRHFQALEEDYATKKSEVHVKKSNLENIRSQINKLRERIKDEWRGGMQELQDHLKNFEEECRTKMRELQGLEKQLQLKETEYRRLDQERGNLLKQEGMIQQEEAANQKNEERLQEMMEELQNVLKAAGEEIDGELDYDSVMTAVSNWIKAKEEEMESTKEDFFCEEAEIQSQIDAVRAKVAQVEKEIQMKKQQQLESKKNHEDVKKRLRELEGSTERLALMDDEEEELKEKIDQIEGTGFMKKSETEIKNLTLEVKRLEDDRNGMQEKVNVLMADKSKVDQISFLTKQKGQKTVEANEKMRAMEDDLKIVFELEELPEDGLVDMVDKKAKQLGKELEGKRAEQRQNGNKLASVKSELKYVTQDLKKNEAKLKLDRNKINEVLGNMGYQEVYDQINEELDETRTNCSFAESASFVYKKYIQKLKKKDCCPLCKRDQSKDLTKKLVEDLEADSVRMKQNVPQMKTKLTQLQTKQQGIIKLKPVWENAQQLETEVIPKLTEKKEELEKNAEKLNDENDALLAILTELEETVKTLQRVRGTVALYENCRKEVKKLDQSISDMERKRDPEAKSIGMTLADAQGELQQLQTKISSKRAEKETREEVRNKKRDELAKLVEQKNKVKEEKLRITAELQNREGLEQQRKDLEVTLKNLVVEIKELQDSLPAIRQAIEKNEKAKTSCVKKKEETLRKLREEKGNMEKQKERIVELKKKLVDFERKRGRFEEIRSKVTACKEKIAKCGEERQEVKNKIDVFKEEQAGQELKKRDLEDNLDLKKKLEEVSKLSEELKEKEKILKQAENRGVSAEKQEVLRAYNKDSDKCNQLRGSKVELQRAIQSLEKELRDPMFKNAEIEYTTRIAKKTIYEKAQRDIRRYRTALDQAIMQFHLKKMEKINKILLEYWRRVYKGNDIDRIMIKTEADGELGVGGKGKVSATSTRKNYNYRVVMVRRGIEIDMRGRCSAGQRVLASIIIRIALAESFGARCGIITLDEPTTNLDQKNINSLADTLADLAEKMISRRSFQLIVITHDQEFTNRLTSVDAVEKYWKVDRDAEGFSRITMVPKRGYGYENVSGLTGGK